MNKKVLILSLTVLASNAFAGDVKPLHALLTGTLPAGTATQAHCDVYRVTNDPLDLPWPVPLLYTSASVVDLSTNPPAANPSRPKLGVKVRRWNGTACVAQVGGDPYVGTVPTNPMHVPAGGLAYDEGIGSGGMPLQTQTAAQGYGGVNHHGAVALGGAVPNNQWARPLAAAPFADVGATGTVNVGSRFSSMAAAPTWCVQVCKYPSSQHVVLGATTLLGAETYQLWTHSHPAATGNAASGHVDTNHPHPVLSATLCNNTDPAVAGSCLFDW